MKKPLGAIGLALAVQDGSMKFDELPPKAKKNVRRVLDSGAVTGVKPIKPQRFGDFSRAPLRRARAV